MNITQINLNEGVSGAASMFRTECTTKNGKADQSSKNIGMESMLADQRKMVTYSGGKALAV